MTADISERKPRLPVWVSEREKRGETMLEGFKYKLQPNRKQSLALQTHTTMYTVLCSMTASARGRCSTQDSFCPDAGTHATQASVP